MTIWDMRKSILLTHIYNCLMETITFEVHPITPTSPRNMLTTIFKSIWFLLLLLLLLLYLFIFFAYLFFEHIMHGHIRKRKEIPNYVKPKTLRFFYVEAYRCDSWLAGFSGEMDIYAFLLEFFSSSRRNEWYEC